MKPIPRHDWTKEEILKAYQKPFLDLVFEAQTVHRKNFKAGEVQKSTLLSIRRLFTMVLHILVTAVSPAS